MMQSTPVVVDEVIVDVVLVCFLECAVAAIVFDAFRDNEGHALPYVFTCTHAFRRLFASIVDGTC